MSFDKYLPGGVIIDVRNNDEWEAGHVEGAIHIPSYEFENRIQDAVPDKKTPINVHCAHGIRSAEAKRILLHMGYENVANVGTPEAAEAGSKQSN